MHIQENTLFEFDLEVKMTHSVAEYPQHNVTYAPAKFEVATTNSLGADPLTRNYII